MNRLSISAILLALVATTAPAGDLDPSDLDAFRMGQQVVGSRLVRDDLEGRVVLAYNWCVS